MSTPRVLTYDDYAAMPDDGKRYELHEGRLSLIPTPTTTHQRILGHLLLILVPHVRALGHGEVMLSPFDCIMSTITVVQPDLIYLDEDRVSLLSERSRGRPASRSRSSFLRLSTSIVTPRWRSTPSTT